MIRPDFCKHFKGILETCAAGIRLEPPAGFKDFLKEIPCRRSNGQQPALLCPHRLFPTDEEVAQRNRELNEHLAHSKEACARIHALNPPRNSGGTVECPVCGQALYFKVHGNGHTWGCCSQGCLQWME